MKYTIFKYHRHTILFFLTIILLFCIYIIIRDCDLPLININPFINPYLEQLFVYKSSDKTLYNIAISYVAAYIFYIIQVHIPSYISNRRAMEILKKDMIKNINDIKLLILLISELTEKKQDELYIKKDTSNIYVIEKSENQILRISFLETYNSLKERITLLNNSILGHHAINHLDSLFVEYFSSIPIDDILALSDNIYLQKKGNLAYTPITDNHAHSNAELLITYIEEKYYFSFETYEITYDIKQQGIYETANISLSFYTSNDLERKVKLI